MTETIVLLDVKRNKINSVDGKYDLAVIINIIINT